MPLNVSSSVNRHATKRDLLAVVWIVLDLIWAQQSYNSGNIGMMLLFLAFAAIWLVAIAQD
jgi:hypothetical protein